jgi:hypothetical protein
MKTAIADLRRGVEPEGTERLPVSGRDAALVVCSPLRVER